MTYVTGVKRKTNTCHITTSTSRKQVRGMTFSLEGVGPKYTGGVIILFCFDMKTWGGSYKIISLKIGGSQTYKSMLV